MNQAYIRESWSSNRVNLHGKIEDLSSGFNLEGKPFSVFIAPHDGSTGDIVLLDVRLLADESGVTSPCPALTGDWCPLSIIEISSASASLLTDCDIYWGRGY